MPDFTMPSLGSDMNAGTLVLWRCKPGDTVKRGDILAEVETDKGLIEVESFATGTVERLLVEPGARVPVGTVLAVIGADATAGAKPAVTPAAPLAAAPIAPTVARPPAGAHETHEAFAGTNGEGPHGPRASPLARRRAAALGLDLHGVTGTGVHGAITLDDVVRAAGAASTPTPIAPTPPAAAAVTSPPPTPTPTPTPTPPPTSAPAPAPIPAPPEPPSAEALSKSARMRAAIGRTMARSKREIPHFYVSSSIELSRALAWLEKHNATHPIEERVLPAALFIRAIALALREFPDLNARWEEDHAAPRPGIHVGMATWLRGGGLVVPAVLDADSKGLDNVMAELKDKVERARGGTLRSSEFADGTITVTNLGDRGVEEVLPIIFPPQVAIVGIGRVEDRPWVADGAVVVRPVARFSLAVDHRAVDGHRAGAFLARVAALLADPERLW